MSFSKIQGRLILTWSTIQAATLIYEMLCIVRIAIKKRRVYPKIMCPFVLKSLISLRQLKLNLSIFICFWLVCFVFLFLIFKVNSNLQHGILVLFLAVLDIYCSSNNLGPLDNLSVAFPTPSQPSSFQEITSDERIRSSNSHKQLS